MIRYIKFGGLEYPELLREIIDTGYNRRTSTGHFMIYSDYMEMLAAMYPSPTAHLDRLEIMK